MARPLLLSVLVVALFGIDSLADYGQTWPVPYNYSVLRPPPDPKCLPRPSPFCVGGSSSGYLPSFRPNDVLTIYALSRQDEQFSKTPMKASMYTYAIGVSSKMSRRNFTFAWQPTSGLFNATIPQVKPSNQLQWCHESALCVSPAIQQKAWSKIQPIGSMPGVHFDAFSVWIKHHNNSQPFYQTLLIRSSGSEVKLWMSPFDGSTFVINAIKTLNSSGARFGQISLPFSFYSVACEAPILLGTASYLQRHQPKVYKDIVDFYDDLQQASFPDSWINWVAFKFKVEIEGKFYYFFNNVYWRLKLHKPHLEVVTYNYKLP